MNPYSRCSLPDYIFTTSLPIIAGDEQKPNGNTEQSIKALLVAAGIQQRTIATALGVSDTSVSEVLKGKRMSKRIRAEIAAQLGKSPAQLWPNAKTKRTIQ